MTKHITSINLDEETERIAKNLDNRSAFMRECLRRWNAFETSTHVHPTETPKCYPSSKSGLCQICWPDGPPPHESWLYYRDTGGKARDRDGNITHHDYATHWIEETAKRNARPQFSIEGIVMTKNQADEANTPPWWRRLLSGFRKK